MERDKENQSRFFRAFLEVYEKRNELSATQAINLIMKYILTPNSPLTEDEVNRLIEVLKEKKLKEKK